MSLSDPLYIIFLGAVFVLYYMLAPGLPRRILLLAASYFFYFELSRFYILVLFLVTAATYYGALILQSRQTAKNSSWLLGVILAVVSIPMIGFKYLSPLLTLGGSNLSVMHVWGSGLQSLAAPIGISFFTFAALGYLIDVYLEVVEPEKDFGRVALFLAFFPLISAGPIERAGRFMSQFDLATPFSAHRAMTGLRLIAIGLVLKLFFAAKFQLSVDPLFAAPGNYAPLEQLFGVALYAFDLYADFAGYSLIAIGSAKLFGLEVRPNFQQPYLSATVPEFWRNWHISLSSWVRDYLFSPLRMEWRRQPRLGMAGALLISFLVLGAWHGAKWGYVMFGAMHGILVTASTFTIARRDAFWKSVHMPPQLLYVQRVIVTFLFVLIPFVVFRARSMADAMIIYKGIFSFELVKDVIRAFRHGVLHLGGSLHLGLLNASGASFILVALLMGGDVMARKKLTIDKFPRPVRIAFYYVAILVCLHEWSVNHVAAPFQYYKF